MIKNMTCIKINDRLKKIVRDTVKNTIKIKKNKINKKLEICVSLISNKKIKELNKIYRNIDSSTDVLSFVMFDLKKKYKNIISNTENKILLGDILISLDKIKEYRSNFNTNFEDELKFLLVHGSLHILGYNHTNEKEKEKMFLLQDRILKNLK
ncbi:MAG: rRNA maturation RNase YbeY [Clostridiales bacterium]|nr:rRNA maturation RNase YbeY [Clostridiales bacterium]